MFLTVANHPVYCHTGGRPFDPALPLIVLVHGAQNDHSVWALQSRYLAHHGYAVLAPDLPGHGASGGPLLPTVEAMADWLLALLDAAGVKQALLAGHSMGSLIALQAAATTPARAAGLVLLGSTWPMRVSDTLLEAALTDEAAAIEMVVGWSHMRAIPGPSTLGPGISVTGVARRLMQRISARSAQPVLHTDFSACNSYDNGARAAASIQCPVLVLQGSHDLMTPARSATKLLEALPAPRIVRVPAGHAMMAEAPDAVLGALGQFASGVFAGATNA